MTTSISRLLSISLLLLSVLTPVLKASDGPGRKAIREAAVLYAKTPVGAGFKLSPKGDRFIALMPEEGNCGFGIFKVDEIGRSVEERRKIRATDEMEVGEVFWVDNDYIAFELVENDTSWVGLKIIRWDREEKPEQETAMRNGRGLAYSLADPIPGQQRKFFVYTSGLGRIASLRFSVGLVAIDSEGYGQLVARWQNPGWVDDWIFRGDKPVAITVGNRIFGVDPDLLRKEANATPEEVFESLSKPGLPGTFLGFADEETVVLAIHDPESGVASIGRYDLKRRVFHEKPLPVEGSVSPDLSNVDLLRLRGNGPVIGFVYKAEHPQVCYFDPGIGSIMERVQSHFEQDVVCFLGLSDTNRILFYEILSDTRDSIVMCLDLQTGDSDTIYATRPWLSDRLCPMRPITFENRNGETIYGFLTLPAQASGDDPPPLVVLSHGGPWARDVWGFDEEVQYYAALGFAVLQVNYRGSTGYGDEYGLNGDLLTIAREAPGDVIDGAKWAISQGYAHPDRIAFCGASFGAFLSLTCAAQAPDLPACVVGFAGVYDLSLMRDEDMEKKKLFAPELYRNYEEAFDSYRLLSPVLHADAINAPVLLVHGGKDDRVSTEQAKVMAKAIRKADGDVELVTERRVLHGFGDEKQKREFYVRVGRFLCEHFYD